MVLEVLCLRLCGFRVGDRYFEMKDRFSRTCCPRCGGPLGIVEEGTDDVLLGYRLDRKSGRIAQKELESA